MFRSGVCARQPQIGARGGGSERIDPISCAIGDNTLWHLVIGGHMFASMASKVRLFVEHPLGGGQSVPLTREQAHYLFGVMRMAEGTVLSLINGADGEWDATVVDAGKKGGLLLCDAQSKPLQMPPDVWLMFAPIRKERTAFIVEKATELGAAKIMPVQTAYTNNADRIQSAPLGIKVFALGG